VRGRVRERLRDRLGWELVNRENLGQGKNEDGTKDASKSESKGERTGSAWV
jgi:hypothetical protein